MPQVIESYVAFWKPSQNCGITSLLFSLYKKNSYFFFFNNYPGIITIKQTEFCLINGFFFPISISRC